VLRFLVSFALALAAAGAHAQGAGSYPGKPVRIIVGFAAGGGIDVMTRFYAQRLSESLKQPFVIENRPGAAGTIAGELVAKAPPDGYTLTGVSVTHAINASLYSKLPYDTVKDFAPISLIALMPDVVAVHPSLPVKTLPELLALARRQPEKLSYASAGSGTLMHVGMELMLAQAKVKMLHIPYNGANPSTLAVLGGQVPVLSTSLLAALPHARSGKLRLLAVTSAERTSLAPEYPTVAEAAGLPGYEAVVWIGLLAPAATPPEIVQKLNGEIERIAQRKEVREQLATLGAEPYREAPSALAERIRADMARWGKIVRESGAKLD